MLLRQGFAMPKNCGPGCYRKPCGKPRSERKSVLPYGAGCKRHKLEQLKGRFTQGKFRSWLTGWIMLTWYYVLTKVNSPNMI